MNTYIVTGISGSGKTTVLKALEDIDYYCVDNIPTILLPEFFKIIENYSENIKNVAVGVDIREKIFLKKFAKIFEKIKKTYPYIKIIFVDAKDDVIIARYKETRRVHPLKEKGFKEAISFERAELKFLKDKADKIIDSSNFTVHELKKFIYNNFSISKDKNFNIDIVSFGFKNGNLVEADLIFDVRFLTNPYFVSSLRDKTGRDKEVKNFIFSDKRADIFLDKVIDLLYFLIPEYIREGKIFMVVGVGCTGGIHRSVAIAEKLYFILKKYYKTTIRHRDL